MDLSELTEVVPLLDPTRLPRVLSRSDALASGYTRGEIDHRLRTGRWRRVLPRTFLTSDTLTWSDQVRAALSFAGPGALLSGGAALLDQRLRCVDRPPSVLVLVPLPTTARSTAWVRIRRTARLPAPALLPGPRRAHLPRAVADLALELTRRDDVRALVSEAVLRRVCTVVELSTELEQGPRQGSAHLRRAIEEVDNGAWSAPEARAATLLRRAGVPPFEQNARIELTGGRFVIADFLWRELRAVLEIDSDAHHALSGDADATSARHLALETAGYSVVHRTPASLQRRPQEFVDAISRWLRARAELVRPA